MHRTGRVKVPTCHLFKVVYINGLNVLLTIFKDNFRDTITASINLKMSVISFYCLYCEL